MEFHISYRHSHGNLHIRAAGLFDDRAAAQLLELLCRECPEGGRVFVDTEQVDDVELSGKTALCEGLGRTAVNRSALFFKGIKGFEMAPDGTRVLVVDRSRAQAPRVGGERHHHCCGRCAHCRCRQGQDAGTRRERHGEGCR